jgi:hypothetical protein
MLKSTHSSSRSVKKTRNEKKKPSARLTGAPVQSQAAKPPSDLGRSSLTPIDHPSFSAGGLTLSSRELLFPRSRSTPRNGALVRAAPCWVQMGSAGWLPRRIHRASRTSVTSWGTSP